MPKNDLYAAVPEQLAQNTQYLPQNTQYLPLQAIEHPVCRTRQPLYCL